MYSCDADLDSEINDNHHLGHIVLNCFKRRRPDDICLINGTTDEKETFISVMNRSVRLARAMTKLGLKPGDVIALGGVNHLDLRIPYFAGTMNGLPIAGVDPFFKYAEIKSFLKNTQARIAFCDYEHEETYKQAAKDIGLDMIVVTFYEGDNSMEKLIESDKEPIENFKPAVFDTKKIYVWLVSTSGTTGVPKLAAMTHEAVAKCMKKMISIGLLGDYVKDGPQKVGFLLSPVQWISAYIMGLGFVLTNTILLSATKPGDIKHLVGIVNKHRPTTSIGSPAVWTLLLNDPNCDMTSFEVVTIGGAKVYKELLDKFRSRVPKNTKILEPYGQTEMVGIICVSTPDTPIGSCGPLLTYYQTKLIDKEGKEITEPNVPGELLYKGPMFSEYYNNPEETEKIFVEDGWMRTGDLMYRDENGYLFYVERLKMLIKYRNTHIVPTELEEIIMQYPGVLEVCVTAMYHKVDQEWPIACVVRRPGHNVTAQDIKDLIAENLSDAKKLRGGVVFLEELPKTSTGKVARMAVRKLAAQAQRE